MTVEETLIRNLAKRLTWKELLEQSLAVLVYNTCPDAVTLTSQEEQEIQALTGKYMRQHLRLNEELVHVITYLQERGLKPVLLKGQGCASYYPNPYLRATGDLDIWIGEPDYEKAKQEIIRLCQSEKSVESPKHLHIKCGKTTLEIHRVTEKLIHPLHHRYYKQLSQEQLSHPQLISINGVDVPIPPQEFNALQEFMHLWHHFSTGGIGLRHYVDLAMILHRDHSHLTTAEFRQQLHRLGKEEEWKMVGGLLVDYLGLPPEEYPHYSPAYAQKGEALLQLSLEEGNFGRKRGRAKTDQPLLSRKVQNLRFQIKRLKDVKKVSRKLYWEQFWQMTLRTVTGVIQLVKQ